MSSQRSISANYKALVRWISQREIMLHNHGGVRETWTGWAAHRTILLLEDFSLLEEEEYFFLKKNFFRLKKFFPKVHIFLKTFVCVYFFLRAYPGLCWMCTSAWHMHCSPACLPKLVHIFVMTIFMLGIGLLFVQVKKSNLILPDWQLQYPVTVFD